MTYRPTKPADRDEVYAKILKLRAEGLSRTIIAQRCQVGDKTITNAFRSAGIQYERQKPRVVVGTRVGRLVVTAIEKGDDGTSIAHCRCDCGEDVTRSAIGLGVAISHGNESGCDRCNRTKRRRDAIIRRTARAAE